MLMLSKGGVQEWVKLSFNMPQNEQLEEQNRGSHKAGERERAKHNWNIRPWLVKGFFPDEDPDEDLFGKDMAKKL